MQVAEHLNDGNQNPLIEGRRDGAQFSKLQCAGAFCRCEDLLGGIEVGLGGDAANKGIVRYGPAPPCCQVNPSLQLLNQGPRNGDFLGPFWSNEADGLRWQDTLYPPIRDDA